MGNARPVTTVRDRPGCVWIAASLFLAVGLLFVVGSLGLFTNNSEDPLWGRLLAFAMGLVGAGIGACLLWRTPLMTTSIDVARRCVVIREQGLAGRREHTIDADQIRNVIVAETLDGDGDATYQAQIVLVSGEHLALSRVWMPDRRPSAKQVEVLGQVLTQDLGVRLVDGVALPVGRSDATPN
ncbi:MAG TPA: hypothetical protein VKN18_11075 [Blastocatellia bacterium]|nr:hypothetical protein [Blastocatellia bacterium]